MPPLDLAGNPLCLVSVHAHPDDEASKGAGTVARYAAEGIRAVLVCCTGGEEGDILNPAVDTPEVRADLQAVREAELRASADAIGYARVYLLGYRDSGMPDTEANARPDNFANAPLDEAVGRLVKIIRRERPQVLITYGDESAFYPHPDHIRVHEISGPAFDAAGDPDRYPEAGEPWQPSKLYYSGFSFRRIRALHEAYQALGEESPYAERMAQWPADVEITPPDHVRRRGRLPRRPARRAARAPDADRSREPLDAACPTTSCGDVPVGGVRARPHRSSTPVPEEPESDLFAGVRAPTDVARGAEVRG